MCIPRWLPLLVPVLALVQTATFAQKSTPEIVQESRCAVVSLVSYDANNSFLGLGSGFFIEGGRIVTNVHVVERAARVEVRNCEDQLLGNAIYAESLSPRIDIAVLPAFAGDAPSVLRFASEEPAVGTSIIAIGSPRGFSGTVSDGIVSEYRKFKEGRLMQISAPISPGSSGGPVLNMTGEVVGVAVASIRDGQNLNFAVPGLDVQSVVRSTAGRFAFPGRRPSLAASPSEEAPDALDWRRVFSRFVSEASLRLEPGKSFTRNLIEDEFSSDSGHNVAHFGLPGRRGVTYEIKVTSVDFDATLSVLGLSSEGEPEVLAEDDDSNGGTNPKVRFQARREGPIVVLVSSYYRGETGRFNILLEGNIPRSVPTISTPRPGSHDRWVFAAETGQYEVYVDRSTLRQNNAGHLEVWTWRRYLESQESSRTQFDSLVDLLDLDCAGKRWRQRSRTYYLGSGSQSQESAAGEWSAWPPKSVEAMIGWTACHLDIVGQAGNDRD